MQQRAVKNLDEKGWKSRRVDGSRVGWEEGGKSQLISGGRGKNGNFQQRDILPSLSLQFERG